MAPTRFASAKIVLEVFQRGRAPLNDLIKKTNWSPNLKLLSQIVMPREHDLSLSLEMPVHYEKFASCWKYSTFWQGTSIISTVTTPNFLTYCSEHNRLEWGMLKFLYPGKTKDDSWALTNQEISVLRREETKSTNCSSWDATEFSRCSNKTHRRNPLRCVYTGPQQIPATIRILYPSAWATGMHF